MNSKISILNLSAFCLLALAWNGCTLGPKYERPKVSVPRNFGELSSSPTNLAILTTNSAPDAQWWRAFNDPELNHLIGEALRSNYDLAASAARIREARYQRSIVAADLFPTIDADSGYLRARGSKNVQLPLGSSGGSSGSSSSSSKSASTIRPKEQAQSQASPNASSGGSQSQSHSQTQSPPQPSASSSSSSQTSPSPFDNQLTPFGKGGLPGVESGLYQIGFDATWELDIFGGNRKRLEAAADDLSAALEAWRGLAVTLLAEVAEDYMELRGDQRRLDIARQNLASEQKTLDLTRSLAQSGLGTQADVARAAAQVAIISATVPPLEAATLQQIHALSILLARDPTALSAELSTNQAIPPAPPAVPIGLPSQLLERRPDIRRAEKQIAAATARIGAARADLFPKFGLTGSVGLDSTSANNLFDWQSRYFLISPTAVWRVFDAGRIISNIALQRANTAETVLAYRSTILNALREVDDALASYQAEQTRRAALFEALRQNSEALRLSRDRYTHGLGTFLETLDAERTQLSAQDQIAQSDQSLATDLVALYKALGGGWNPSTPPNPAPNASQ